MSPEQAWAEAFGRMQTAAFTTVHGRMRCQSPAGDATNDYEVEFWHETPDRWRVQDEHGLWYLDDGNRVLLRTENGIEHISLTGHLGPRDQQHPRYTLNAEEYPNPDAGNWGRQRGNTYSGVNSVTIVKKGTNEFHTGWAGDDKFSSDWKGCVERLPLEWW